MFQFQQIHYVKKVGMSCLFAILPGSGLREKNNPAHGKRLLVQNLPVQDSGPPLFEYDHFNCFVLTIGILLSTVDNQSEYWTRSQSQMGKQTPNKQSTHKTKQKKTKQNESKRNKTKLN